MAAEMTSGDPSQQGATTWVEEDGYDIVPEGGDSSRVHHSDQQVQEPEYNVAPALPVPGDSPSFDGTPVDPVGDYDPEAVIPSAPTPQSVEPHAVLQPSPQPAAKKRKTAGGFIVGDSDSEGDDSATPSSNDLAARQEAAGVASIPPTTSQVDSATNGSVGAVPGAGAPPSIPTTSTLLPHDIVGLLEARIKEDPRGAMDSWLALIAEHRRRNRVEEAKAVYKRFLEVFPESADIWVAFIEMELSLNDFVAAEALFSRSIKEVLNVQLWTVYLDYIRRRNDLSDSSGQARLTVNQAYEFVLENVGLDKDSGKIWLDYIQFIRFGPGTIGGSGWQDQQKMDQLRKAYQRAICVPISNVNILWKEYDQFEMGLNKMTGRKFLAERSPAYMSAKSANTALENLTRSLQRSSLPRLPPIPGFEGDVEYAEQVELWKKWVAWEKSDPLDLKTDEPELLKRRILYCYNQALMALRFWPEMWVDAAEWCFENDITDEGKDKGLDFLLRGIAANPESILLALKHADRIELTYPTEEGDDAKIARGEAVKVPYNKILDTLYSLAKTLKDKEKVDVQKIEDSFAASEVRAHGDDDEYEDIYDDEGSSTDRDAKAKAKDEQIALVKQGLSAQLDLLSKALTFVWIALARAMRRIQGKGDPKGPLGGLRQIFHDARSRGRLGSEIYVAIAKMEWKCYNDKAGGKIFDRGSKLFPEDPFFMIEYIKYMIAHNDITNSRVVFETCVSRLVQKPETIAKAKPLLLYMHKRESEFGDLPRVVELEKRMAALYPEDPKLANFSARYSTEKFDPIAARIIVSPAAQLRPKMILPSIERAATAQRSPGPGLRQPNSPRPQSFQVTNSPKRPFPVDDLEDLNPPRKMMRGDQRDFQRGESPLKGAAGRRLDQQRRLQNQGPVSASAAPVPLPTAITFLLGQVPSASHYNSERFGAARLVSLLQATDVDLNTWEARKGKSTRQAVPSHARQVSAEYAQGRNSPALGGRPLSPFSADRGRLPPGSATYRQTSLRPESRDSYEPPPPAYRQDVPVYATPASYEQLGMSAWQQAPHVVYGAPTPGYAPPGPQYQQPQQPPPQQGPPYGGYRY